MFGKGGKNPKGKAQLGEKRRTRKNLLDRKEKNRGCIIKRRERTLWFLRGVKKGKVPATNQFKKGINL